MNRNAELSRLDHRACEDRGYAWPSGAYVDCRRFRADDRQREQWMEMQMTRQQQQPEVGIRPGSPVEPYLPIREDAFRCLEAEDAAGETFIDCQDSGQ